MSRPTWLKAIAALLGGVGGWMVTALEDELVSGVEWGGLVIALGTALTVYGLRNGESTDPTTSTPEV